MMVVNIEYDKDAKPPKKHFEILVSEKLTPDQIQKLGEALIDISNFKRHAKSDNI